MKRKSKDMSQREYDVVSKFISDVLYELHMESDADCLNCAWLAFMAVYRKHPDSFTSSDSLGWIMAYQAIVSDLERERTLGQNRFFREISIENTCCDDSISLDNLIALSNNDCSHVIYARDFISSLDVQSHIMLKGLMSGQSVSQISNQHKWRKSEAKSILLTLQDSAAEYFM